MDHIKTILMKLFTTVIIFHIPQYVFGIEPNSLEKKAVEQPCELISNLPFHLNGNKICESRQFHLEFQPVPCEECFSLAKIPEDKRKYVNQLLSDLLKRGFAYTFIGNLKPITENQEYLNQTDCELLKSLECGKYFDFYCTQEESLKNNTLFLIRRDLVRQKLDEMKTLPYGIDKTLSETAIISRAISTKSTNEEDTSQRYYFLGTMFGFPQSTVEAFSKYMSSPKTIEMIKDTSGKVVEFKDRTDNQIIHKLVFRLPVLDENKFQYEIPFVSYFKSKEEQILNQKEAKKYLMSAERIFDFLNSNQEKITQDPIEFLRTVYRGKDGKCSPLNLNNDKLNFKKTLH